MGSPLSAPGTLGRSQRTEVRNAAAPSLVVYEWDAWTNYLITRVLPGAVRIAASPRRSTRTVLAALPDDASAFLFHINCTLTSRFPSDRATLVAQLRSRGLRLVNADVTDLTKRHLQRTCVRIGLNSVATGRAGPDDELVIVKTDLNSAGIRERYLGLWRRWRLGIRVGRAIQGRDDYRVLRRADVPHAWWNDRTLVVERYIVNRDNVWYRAYLWLDRLVVSRASSTSPVKRMYDGRERTNSMFVLTGGAPVAVATHEIPQAVLQAIVTLANRSGLEFGTFDIACDDRGNAYVVDLNTTPFCRDGSDDIVAHLAEARFA